MMEPLWAQICVAAIGAVFGAIAGGSLSIIEKINEWLRKPFFELKIWCVPVFGQSDAQHMYCIAKLKVLKKMKGHEWLYLYPNTFDFPSLIFSPSRNGIGCKKIPDNGLRICQLRQDDEVDLRFLVRPEDAVAGPNSYKKIVDYHLSPKIRRRKLNIFIDVLPE